MKAQLVPYHKLSEEAHRELREQLDHFYSAVPDYTAFETPSDQRSCWDHVIACIKQRLRDKPRLRVLEIGAGRTGFARYLNENRLRETVEFHAHDVTRLNEEWLRAEADNSFFGDVSSANLPGGYDVIFSTYVLEHVTDPVAHLEQTWSLLSDDADLF